MTQPTRNDERQLASLVLRNLWLDSARFANFTKRDAYILDKWARRGWWDDGFVSLRVGNVLPKGIEPLTKLAEEATWE